MNVSDMPVHGVCKLGIGGLDLGLFIFSKCCVIIMEGSLPLSGPWFLQLWNNSIVFDQCFPVFNGHTDPLGILLSCGFWFGESGIGSEILWLFKKLPGDSSTEPWPTVWVETFNISSPPRWVKANRGALEACWLNKPPPPWWDDISGLGRVTVSRKPFLESLSSVPLTPKHCDVSRLAKPCLQYQHSAWHSWNSINVWDINEWKDELNLMVG